jgi:uroporphyrinogen III methyltransferase/synthase
VGAGRRKPLAPLAAGEDRQNGREEEMKEKGKVWLVGAGPGDPGLLTLRAKAALEAADVVVYDRLVSEELLFLVPSPARLVPVGKSAGRHPVPQEEINRILLGEARAGNTVVRLKGGDSFLFGRGGEEMLFLAENGVPCEAVPGVSSVFAAAADSRVPLTHRDFSSSLHIISWRGRDGGCPKREALEALARLGGTLAILMGASALRDIGRRLAGAGFSRDLPAVVVGDASTSRRSVGVFTVGGLCEAEAPDSPAVILVGEVCRLHVPAPAGGPAAPPLAGCRIVVTRHEPTNAELRRKIRCLGAEAIPFPCIRIVPLDLAEEDLAAAGKFSWIVFTAATGIDIFFDACRAAGKDLRLFSACRFAVTGPASAQALRKRGFLPDYMPDTYSGEALGEGLAEMAAAGETVLLARGRRAAAGLAEALGAKGVSFRELCLYDTLPAEGGAHARALIAGGRFDYVFFASPSAVRSFRDQFPSMDFSLVRAVCIGQTTADCAGESGMAVYTPKEATTDAMCRLVCGLVSPGGIRN